MGFRHDFRHDNIYLKVFFTELWFENSLFWWHGEMCNGIEQQIGIRFWRSIGGKAWRSVQRNVQPGVNLSNPKSTDNVPALFQTNSKGSSKIKWEWAFEEGHTQLSTYKITQTDVYDTELGNHAANGEAPTISLKLETTVTQIDECLTT